MTEKTENFYQLLWETRSLLQAEINADDKQPNAILTRQLRLILTELDKMEQIKNSRHYLPYYPQGIIDSWDYANPLAEKLLRLLDYYQKL